MVGQKYFTGDIKNSLDTLTRTLKSLNYKGKYDIQGLIIGKPETYLPLLDYILLGFSKNLSMYLVQKGYEFYARTDLKFVEGAYKYMRDELGYNPTLKPNQFLTIGYAERKIIMLCELATLCKKRHNEFVKIARRNKRKQKAATEALKNKNKKIERSNSQPRGGKYERVLLGREDNSFVATEPTQKEVQVVDNQVSEPNLNYTVTVERSTIMNQSSIQKKHTSKSEIESPATEAPLRSSSGSPSTAVPPNNIDFKPNAPPRDTTPSTFERETYAPQANQHQVFEDQILQLLSQKFDAFDKKLDDIGSNLDTRMTLLENKVKYIQDQIQEGENEPIAPPPIENVVVKSPQRVETKTASPVPYAEADILPEQTFGTNIVVSPSRQTFSYEKDLTSSAPVSPDHEEPSAPFDPLPNKNPIISSQDNVVVLEEAIKHSHETVTYASPQNNDGDINQFIERMKNRVETTNQVLNEGY